MLNSWLQTGSMSSSVKHKENSLIFKILYGVKLLVADTAEWKGKSLTIYIHKFKEPFSSPNKGLKEMLGCGFFTALCEHLSIAGREWAPDEHCAHGCQQFQITLTSSHGARHGNGTGDPSIPIQSLIPFALRTAGTLSIVSTSLTSNGV